MRPGALVKLLLLTGCRRDDMCYLRPGQIQADKIIFAESYTKNNEPHTVPLTPAMRRVLDSLPAGGEYVLLAMVPALGGHSKARAAIVTPMLLIIGLTTAYSGVPSRPASPVSACRYRSQSLRSTINPV